MVTRTSLLLSVDQSTLPFRVTICDLPTSLLRSFLHLFSSAAGRVCQPVSTVACAAPPSACMSSAARSSCV